MDLQERQISSIIDAQSAGQRLDHWLSRRFTYQSRQQWQDQIKAGRITLNGRPTRCSRVLQAGETVTFTPEEGEEPAVEMQYEIIYEDDHLLGIDKGGNLPCHPAGPFFRHTLWYELSQRYDKVSIINRLDRETSGVMVVAKTAEAARLLTEQFQTEQIHKQYYALVYGNFDAPVDATGWLTGDPSSEVRKKRRFVTAHPQGNDAETAVTRFRPIRSGTARSLVEAAPATGRLHQIRATLCSLGYPLLGDKLYGPDDTIYLRFIAGTMTEADRGLLVLPRQALHASRLEFVHPMTGQTLTFVSPLPFDLMVAATADD